MSNGINGTTILRSSASAKNVSPEVTNAGTHTKLGGARRTVFVQVGSGIRPSNNANATTDNKVRLGKPKAPDRRILTGNVPQLDTDQLMLCRFILNSVLESEKSSIETGAIDHLRVSGPNATVNPLLVETIDAIDAALEVQAAPQTQEAQPRQLPVQRRPNRVSVDGRQSSAGRQNGGLAPRRVQRAAPTPEPESVDAE